MGQAPDRWTFLGQCYDAGEGNERICAITQQPTRFAFTLKPKHGGKGRMTISPEAIPQFERYNPDLYIKLKVGLNWLEMRTVAVAADVRKAKERKRLADAENSFGKLRKEAHRRIREFRKLHRKAQLPQYLESMRILLQTPGHFFAEESSRALYIEERTTQLEASLAAARESEKPAPVVPEITENLFDHFDDIPEIDFDRDAHHR